MKNHKLLFDIKSDHISTLKRMDEIDEKLNLIIELLLSNKGKSVETLIKQVVVDSSSEVDKHKKKYNIDSPVFIPDIDTSDMTTSNKVIKKKKTVATNLKDGFNPLKDKL